MRLAKGQPRSSLMGTLTNNELSNVYGCASNYLGVKGTCQVLCARMKILYVKFEYKQSVLN